FRGHARAITRVGGGADARHGRGARGAREGGEREIREVRARLRREGRLMLRRRAWLLTIAGALPFVAATAALLAERSAVRVPAIAALVTYAAVILSFLGGIEWGLAVQESPAAASAKTRDRLRAIALLVSTLPSLAAWGLLWLPS